MFAGIGQGFGCIGAGSRELERRSEENQSAGTCANMMVRFPLDQTVIDESAAHILQDTHHRFPAAALRSIRHLADGSRCSAAQ